MSLSIKSMTEILCNFGLLFMMHIFLVLAQTNSFVSNFVNVILRIYTVFRAISPHMVVFWKGEGSRYFLHERLQ